jgi:hypothetical protein
MIGLTDGWGRLRGKLSGGHARPALKAWERRLSRLDRPAAVAAGAVVAALSAWWTWGVVTQRFYTSERRTIRFGTGLLRSAVPLDEARWIDTHKPQGRAFCDFGTSSNLMYFTRPHREVPLLTNTWACPPYVMKQTILWGQGREGFEAFATEYDVGVVVLRQLLTNRRLMEKLAGSPDWAVVHLGAHYVVFLRRSGSNAALARQAEITQQNFQLGPFIQQVLASDPASGFSLHSGGLLLRRLGWKDHALSVWRRCAELPEPYPDSLWSLGASLLARAAAKARDMSGYLGRGMSQEAEHARRGALEDLAEARQALRRALKLNPRLRQASEDLQRVEQALAALEATGPSSRESR